MQKEYNYNLKPYNTFGIAAKAKIFISFSSIEELREALEDAEIKKHKKMVLGGGSNVLFTNDFEGVVLLNSIQGKSIVKETEDNVWVKAGGGEIWHDLVLFCVNKGFAGIENLSLIPGTVGAAPIQNIGAYGVELKDVFDQLTALNIESGKMEIFSFNDCCFGYRSSIFKKEQKGKFIITSVSLRLKKKPFFNISYGTIKDTIEAMGISELSIKAVSDAVIKIRRSKLPDPSIIGNAGSFFKNPEIPETLYVKLKAEYPDLPSYPTSKGFFKIPAGWLNEKCGWKGMVVGQTGVHKHQALVLVNYGNAQGEAIKTLSEEIQRSVFEKFGIKLETEVNII